jgi:REP element-mobilizing transposase RayT
MHFGSVIILLTYPNATGRLGEYPGNTPMTDPLAYFLTWTTYGSWLPGDERGWVERPGQFRSSNPQLASTARLRLTEDPCVLDFDQRRLVEETITKHCELRGWYLHVVNCRTNHVHVVVTAPVDPEIARDQFKSWCTRQLKTHQAVIAPSHAVRIKWWTERGSNRWLNDEESLAAAIQYVRDCQ